MANDKESIQQIIRDTVYLLCQNSLLYDVGVRVQGLIGITVDNSDVMLVHFDESYSNEQHSQHQNIDSLSTASAAMPEPLKPSPRKRTKLPKTAASVRSRNVPAEMSATDIVFVANDASDNDARLGLELFCSSIDNDISYDQVGNSSPVFKSEDSFITTDVNPDIDSTENQSGYEYKQYASRSKLTDENNYVADLDQARELKSESVLCEEATVQTTNLRRKLTASRPHVKQVSHSQILLQLVES